MSADRKEKGCQNGLLAGFGLQLMGQYISQLAPAAGPVEWDLQRGRDCSSTLSVPPRACLVQEDLSQRCQIDHQPLVHRGLWSTTPVHEVKQRPAVRDGVDRDHPRRLGLADQTSQLHRQQFCPQLDGALHPFAAGHCRPLSPLQRSPFSMSATSTPTSSPLQVFFRWGSGTPRGSGTQSATCSWCSRAA